MREDLAELLAPWRQVAAKVDGFFKRVERSYVERMSCAAGCAACCQQDLTVLFIEALAVLTVQTALPAETQAAIAEDGGNPSAPPCAFLDDEGRCRVYAGRPLVCRSHGLPIRQDHEVAICELNFRGVNGEGYPADATMNASLATAGLTVADALIREKLGLDEQPRVALRLLARHGVDALTPASRRALEA
ncbi:MAG: hypothetical protein CSB49_06450 [Proteobacteria bacterium]|nr:MAG: hypothetical protein CSB49_06450 [Pseudomonadota bacterium]